MTATGEWTGPVAKGISEELANDAMVDVSYFGTLMVYCGDADGMVSGANHTTQHTIRPAFETIRTKPGTKLVSSVFLMCMPDRVLVYGDCAINPNPDAEALANIAISSAETAVAFGVEPRIVNQAFPADGGARFLEIHPHQHLGLGSEFLPQRDQAARVVEGALGIVN